MLMLNIRAKRSLTVYLICFSSNAKYVNKPLSTFRYVHAHHVCCNLSQNMTNLNIILLSKAVEDSIFIYFKCMHNLKTKKLITN